MERISLLATLCLSGCAIKPCETGGPVCAAAVADDSGSGETGSDDTDTDAPETGVGVGSTVLTLHSAAGLFLSGESGYRVEDRSGALICEDLSDLAETGEPAPSGCPECEWAFQLVVVDGASTGGCDGVLVTPIEGGTAGSVYPLGFAESYDMVYGGSVYPVGPALFYYTAYTGYEGWYLVAYGAIGTAEYVSVAGYAGYLYYWR